MVISILALVWLAHAHDYNPKPIFKLNISQSIIHEAIKSQVANIRVNVCPHGFEDALLAKINQLRAQHQAPPVHISVYRTANSDPWENERDFYSTVPMIYYTHWEQYVTNQTARAPLVVTISVDEVARVWYLEPAQNYHDYGREPAIFGVNERLNYFVQLVWKSAKSVSILCSFDHRIEHGKIFTYTVIEAFMEPNTNVEGQFAANVLPPIGIQRNGL